MIGGRPAHPQGNNQGNGKEKIDLKALKKLFAYCKSYLPAIITSLLLAVVGAVTTIIGPDRIKELMDLIVSALGSPLGINMTKFLKIVIILICLYGAGVIANYLQNYVSATITHKTAKKLRTDINQKINKLPLKYFDTTTRGNVLSRVTNDVDTVSQTLSSTVSNLINAIITFLGVIVMMFVTNWILALTTIATSLIGFALTFVILSKSQKYFNRRQHNLGEMNGYIEETFTNHSVIKAYNAEDNTKEQFDKINKKLYENNWKSQSLSGLMPSLMSFVGNLSYVMVFIVGVALILNGSTIITFGTISSFIIYANLFSQPLSTMAQSLGSLQQASAASKRIFEMLDETEMSDESGKTKKLTKVKGNVEFKNVRFGYDKDNVIIKDFSAKFNSGQKIAIVGPTGAGKTTIVNLLMRFYELDAGEILIDGVSISDIKRENLRDLFDMILQDSWLFDGTIRENLVYNKQGVTDKQLDKVCKVVGLTHFVQTLKDGYDTQIDSGVSLSEGQKQQITIARAMIKNSSLLILDEATSSVDTRTELKIQKAMDKLTEGRTSFVIAHRLSTIKNADVILVINDGNIVESGKHTELLKKGGYYAELYNSQFANIG